MGNSGSIIIMRRSSAHKSSARSTFQIASRFIALLVMLPGFSVRADDGVDSFLAGLDAVAVGKFEEGALALGKAAEANPAVANWHLDRAIALMLIGRGDEAHDAISIAEKLDSRSSEIHLRSIARAMMFDPKLPESPAQPVKELAYSPKLLVAIMGTKSPKEPERARARLAIEEVVRELAKEQRGGVEGIKALYGVKRYREALALVDAALVKRPGDGVLLGFAGHCKLGLKDFGESRQSYTEGLRVFPTEAGYLIGRARCEIALGAIEPAEGDLALASRVGFKAYSTLLAEAQQLLAAAKGKEQQGVERPSRAEQYTRELSGLQLDIRDHPDEVQYLLALSQFYLQPMAVCEVTLNGTVIKARVPCGKMELSKATEALERAVKIAPDQSAVLLQQARVRFAHRQPDEMMALAQRALDNGAMDLEIAVAYLQYDSDGAKWRTAQATKLRAPGYFRDVLLPNGKFEKMYFGPSVNDFNRADGLDRTAKEMHAQATRGLEFLQKQTADRTDPQGKAIHAMTNAYHDAWFTNVDGAIAAAEEALGFDPANVHALRFLISAYKSKGSPKVKQYQAMLGEIERQ
jgi:tetratricopeptide (TPR) repeat protein